jgi:YfiH family protein
VTRRSRLSDANPAVDIKMHPRSLGPARVWCTDRHGGVSLPPYDSANVADHVGDDPDAVAANRRRIAVAAGLVEPTRWVWLEQVHGVQVHVATGPTGAAPPQADAAVTATRGLPLAIVTADCAPIALACDDAIGAVHAGHPGLEHGVIEAAVTALRAIGTGPVRAYLGPCIRPARYEFGADDLERLVTRFGPAVAGRTEQGGLAFDVPAAVRISLEECGVDAFEDSGVCTSESAAHFSYRRDGVTGRQATIVTLP